MASRFDIQGYPTLKWFANENVIDFEAPGREESDLIDFINEHADPNWEPPKSEVVVLSGSNFDDFVNSHELSLVEFYAPWCGHCKRLAPEYERAARKLAERPGSPIPLAKVDATAEDSKELATKFEIQGYPTLKVFRNGRIFDFKAKGQPTEHSIVSYMESQSAPASRLLDGRKGLKKALKEAVDDIVICGFFESESDKFYQTYLDAANELREDNYQFVHVLGSENWKDFDIFKPTIVVYTPEHLQTKFEPKRHEFTTADATRIEVSEFVRSNSVPLVGHYTYPSRDMRYKDKKPLCLFFYTVDFSHEFRDSTQMWRKKIAEIAKDHRDITFAIANDDEFTSQMNEMGLEDSAEEINVACYDARGLKYPLDPPMEEWSEKHVRSFIKKMKEGKLKPYYKSQAVPSKGRDKDGEITVVVGKTFDKIVMESEKDVLLFIYAPWCGHCKNFAPEYKKLAKKVMATEKDNLIVAKIDATANDVPPSFVASGYPTIYFAAAGHKDTPFKYEGSRDPDDIILFMKKHASKAFITSKSTDEDRDEL